MYLLTLINVSLSILYWVLLKRPWGTKELIIIQSGHPPKGWTPSRTGEHLVISALSNLGISSDRENAPDRVPHMPPLKFMTSTFIRKMYLNWNLTMSAQRNSSYHSTMASIKGLETRSRTGEHLVISLFGISSDRQSAPPASPSSITISGELVSPNTALKCGIKSEWKPGPHLGGDIGF